jgi:hypothetical protein
MRHDTLERLLSSVAWEEEPGLFTYNVCSLQPNQKTRVYEIVLHVLSFSVFR